uniref:HIRA interacting protein 3 n=1 Tax=Gopherus agassizii TaxID=38772 RepID=A0A452GRP9_9SAUR
MAADQEMRDFTRGLFQSRPDLRVLTLAVVRSRYLAHVGRESLRPEDKELLKELVKEELLRMQLDDSSSEGGSPSPKSARDAPQAGAEKRLHSSSDSSGGPGDTARKKQRLDQGSEASSDGEDSGIDSKKPKEDAGKSGHTGLREDKGDSGAEETPEQGGASRESDSEWAARSEGPKQPQRRTEGAEAQDQLGKKQATEAEQRGEGGKANGGLTAQPGEESGSESPVEEEECKRQKQTGKTGLRKAKRRSDSEEEGDSKEKGRMKARGKEEGSGAEVDEKCQSRKGAGKKGWRKAGRWSDSEEEENKEKITKAQREEGRSRKPGTRKVELERKKRRTKAQSEEESGSESEEGRSRKPGRKKVERRSDSEAEEVGSRKKRTKAQSEEESGSESEEGRSRKPGRKKVERRSDSEAEEVGSRKKRRTKAQSEEESGSESEEGASRKETGKKGRRKAERGSESEEEGKVQRGSSETDEDSSSSSSAQDENSPNPGSRRKKGKAPGSGVAGPAEEHPAVRRLKRYILACGVRRNYKKLLAGCRSVKQRVGVLRRELEAIGLQGEWEAGGRDDGGGGRG